MFDVVFVTIPAALASTIIAFPIRKIAARIQPPIEAIYHVLGPAGARGAFDPGYL